MEIKVVVRITRSSA